jgi:hypothetical protein
VRTITFDRKIPWLEEIATYAQKSILQDHANTLSTVLVNEKKMIFPPKTHNQLLLPFVFLCFSSFGFVHMRHATPHLHNLRACLRQFMISLSCHSHVQPRLGCPWQVWASICGSCVSLSPVYRSFLVQRPNIPVTNLHSLLPYPSTSFFLHSSLFRLFRLSHLPSLSSSPTSDTTHCLVCRSLP